MKITLLATFLVAFTFGWPPALSGQNLQVPSEIEQYMYARNFIASLSTPDERHTLSGFVTAEDVFEHTGSERLKKVFSYANFLNNLEIEIGSGITFPMNEKRKFSNLGGIHQIKDIQYQNDGSELFLNVVVYRLHQETITHFISAYEQNDSPPEIKLPSPTGPAYIVQTWVKVNGSWMKKAADFHFLEQ